MSESKRAIVTGGAGGLGALICQELIKTGYDVFVWDKTSGLDVLHPNKFDLELDFAAKGFNRSLDLLVNCAGINKINWLTNVAESEFDEVMDVNAKGIFLMTQHFYPALHAAKGTVLNIVSNAANMPMRCSAAYNASKAAALALTKQLARELSPQITVFSVSPNKLEGTGMSRDIEEQVIKTRGWSAASAKAYQQAALLAKEETPPRLVAEFIGYLLADKERHKFLTGCDIPYGA